MKKKANVIGAGILGLAYARALAEIGYSVTVFERSQQSQGSSIRNFGMIWPIGQHSNGYLNRALRTREIWLDICKKSKIWHSSMGSLQILQGEIELELAEQFFQSERNYRTGLTLLNKEQLLDVLPHANKAVSGAISSSTEVVVESREAIRQIPIYLSEKYDICFNFGTAVTECLPGKIKTNLGITYEADLCILASGYETQLLYADVFKEAPITISSLNMFRTSPFLSSIPSICGGLSFLHYPAYEVCQSLTEYHEHCIYKYPALLQNGIHMLISQNQEGQLTIGDSHHYGDYHDPFREDSLDNLIIDYMNELLVIENLEIKQRWTGQYLKMTNGSGEWFTEIEDGVYIANGPGGAGMTLGWGMAEETINQI
jgi:FAD dependent oxidoreductase TIGR03364